MTSDAATAFGHRPDLDHVRGIAIGLVLAEHLIQSIYGLDAGPALGLTGMSVFFVLSGFLITSLLMREERVDLRRFYLRRIVRLAPALAVVSLFIVLMSIYRQREWVTGLLSTYTYTTNIAIQNGLQTDMFSHTWSLSIEEQFYLIWPVLLLLVPRRFVLPIALVAALGLFAGMGYYSTVTNVGGIAAGCALALSGRQGHRVLGPIGLCLIVAAVLTGERSIAVLGTVLLISAPMPLPSPLGPLGRRAYSLYLWHPPLILLLGPIGLGVSFLAAAASYRLVERPVLRRFHERLTPRRINQGGEVGQAVYLPDQPDSHRALHPDEGRA